MITHTAPSARILAADDDPAALRVLSRILSWGGYTQVCTTADGGDVERLFHEWRPDLLLLDLHMDGVTATEVIHQLRRQVPEGEYLPMLVLSGDVSQQARLAALGEGAADFILKPYAPEEVLLRVRNHLSTRALHQAVREQNRTLEARVAERTLALDRTAGEVLERLAVAAELRDDETGLHTRRVGELSGALAAALGLPAADVEMIRRVAPLHDIGKIGIPDAVLRKPGRLTPPEWEIMKSHAEIGARILSDGRSDVVLLAEQVAHAHHERWDGTGYPRGLSGAAIPLAARIVALADVFDALMQDRPYRPAWPLDRVLAEIRATRGTHFDPDVADAFLATVAPGLAPAGR